MQEGALCSLFPSSGGLLELSGDCVFTEIAKLFCCLRRRMSRNVGPWALLFACLFIFSLPGFATTINPTSATIQEYSTKQFTASTPSKWTTTCGTISSSGLLTAPLYPATSCHITAVAISGSGSATATSCHITAVAISGSGSATALVNIVSPIVMTPASAKTPQGKTQQFTASMPVTWIAKCGTITAGGLFRSEEHT